MKRIITLIALSFPLIAFAQIEKGKSIVTGYVGFSSDATKFDGTSQKDKSSSFTLYGTYAYLISDRWAIGIKPSLGLGHRVSESISTETHSNEFGVAPVVRRYFALGEKFFINVDASIGFSWQKDKTEGIATGNSSTSKQSQFGIGINPGVTYLATNKFALQASLGSISYNKLKPVSGDYWSFSSSLGISSFSLGASWLF